MPSRDGGEGSFRLADRSRSSGNTNSPPKPSISLPSPGISEIQVFGIALKTEELDESILRTIDKAIPFPILFQLTHGDHPVRHLLQAAQRCRFRKWVIEACFHTDWFHPSSLILHPLPVSLDLAALHEQLVRQHLPLPARQGESLQDQVARFLAIQAKEKQCQQLDSRLKQERSAAKWSSMLPAHLRQEVAALASLS